MNTVQVDYVYIRCIGLMDRARQKILVNVGDIWVVEDDKFSISQSSQCVVLIVPCQALHHRTCTMSNRYTVNVLINHHKLHAEMSE